MDSTLFHLQPTGVESIMSFFKPAEQKKQAKASTSEATTVQTSKSQPVILESTMQGSSYIRQTIKTVSPKIQ